MTIRTKLLIIAILPAFFLVASWLLQYSFTQRSRQAHAKSAIADLLIQDFANLTILTLEHHIYYELRSHTQWENKYRHIGRRLEEAELMLKNADERPIMEMVRNQYRNIGYLFAQYGPHNREGRPIEKSTDWQKFADLLTSRLLQELQRVAIPLEQIRTASENLELEYTRKHDLLMLSFLIALSVSIPLFTYLAYVAVARPLLALREGIGTIAAGNLDHRLGITSHDEIGAVATAFDTMTGYLKTAGDELRRANEELETRVQQRTLELTTLNRQLVREIEERKEAEDARRTSEARYRTLFDNASDGIMILDLNGQILGLNRNFCERLGYREEELLGKTPQDLDPPEYAVLVDQRVADIREKGESLFETAHIRKDGSIMPVEVSARVVEFGGRQVVMSIVRDISERKQTEEELRHLKDAAEAASRAKSQFLANMSHEIRTPIHTIIGLGYLALQSELTPKLRDYLTKINSSAESLHGIINEVLDFSKIEAGKVGIERIPFRLADMLGKIEEIAGIWTGEKHLELLFRVDPQVPAIIVGDPLRLGQVLNNLINNAVKFTDSGQVVVTVATGGEPVDSDSVNLRFSVADSGIGMTEELLSRLFQPFTQADSSTTRKYGGTGLGLSICKRLVEMMGGTIRAESRPSRGSVFSFTVRVGRGIGASLDKEDQPPSLQYQARTTAADVLRQLQGARVLVAEDHGVNQLIIKELLGNAGIEVVLAGSGREAVAAVEQAASPFDAVLMDIQLPEMDGYEATRRIRSIAGMADLPIIAMTAHALPDEREKCLAAGMNQHLGKPLDVPRLYETLLHFITPRKITSNRAGASVSPPPLTPEDTVPFPAELPGFNVAEGIDRLDGNSRLLREIIISFAADKRHVHAEIGEALRHGDWKQAERLVHGIKGIAGNIAANRLYETSMALEEALEERREEGLPGLLTRFQECMQEVLVAAEILAGMEIAAGNEGLPPPGGAAASTVIGPAFTELYHLLQLHDLQAEQAFARLRALCGDIRQQERIASIGTAIGRLEFQQALDGMRELAADLDLPGGESI
jgi:PAS domain S-box-containing protein